MGVGQKTAQGRLARLFPRLGPWTEAALWHGQAEVAAPSTPIDAELEILLEQRLAPLALRYIQSNRIDVDPFSVRRLRQNTFTWAQLTHSILATSPAYLDLFAQWKIPIAVSKGPGVAAAYRWPDCRPYSDLDILASPDDFLRAEALLGRHGWIEEDRNIQPWRYFNRHCREGLNLNRRDGESVDLHHHVPPWMWSQQISIPRMIGRSSVLGLVGTAVPCLSFEDNLLIVALHVISDKNKPGKTLIVWRDLVELAAKVDPALARRRAEEAGLAGWLRALLIALPEPVRPHELIAALPNAPIPHALRLRALVSENQVAKTLASSQFMRLPLLNGVSFLGGMAMPSPQFLSLKYPDSSQRYLKWWLRRTS